MEAFVVFQVQITASADFHSLMADLESHLLNLFF